MIKLFVFGALLFCFAGFFFLSFGWVPAVHIFAHHIHASGETTTETRTINSFSKLNLQSSAHVIVTHGDQTALTITGDKSALSVLKTEVKGSELVIWSNENYDGDLTIHVTTPNLERVLLEGSGEISAKEFSSQSFEATIDGSGDIDASITASKVKADIEGSGVIKLSGTTDQYAAEVAGSGTIESFDLQAKSGSISISGSGESEVHCTDALAASVSGSGGIYYKGAPTALTTTISGSGTIEKRN